MYRKNLFKPNSDQNGALVPRVLKIRPKETFNQTRHHYGTLVAPALVPKAKPQIRSVIHAIEIGLPENQLSQEDCLIEFTPNEILEDVHKFKKVHSLYMNTQIESRHVTKSFMSGNIPFLEDKMEAYKKEGSALAIKTARKALAKANINPGDIGQIVFVSSTALASPGLDATIIEELGLSRNIKRTNIGFVGCSGGLNGLSLIDDYCVTKPGMYAHK